jgi:CRISP-associated protein Cas1
MCLNTVGVTRRGLPALAQDLLEEFRTPVVERWVAALFNRQQVNADDFIPGPRGGVRLNGETLREVLRDYEATLTAPFTLRTGREVTFRRLLADQTAQVQRVCRTGAAYRPFRWDRGG